MAKTVVKQALRWRGVVRRVRDKEFRFSEQNYPDWLVLSFINYESSGDPAAVNGRHRGLLQINEDNAEDEGITRDSVDGTVTPPDVAGVNSIRHFFKYMKRYKRWKPRGYNRKVGHEFDPERMAILWKGGPGLLRDFVIALEDNGRTGKNGAEAVLVNAGARHDGYRDDILKLMSEMRGRPVEPSDLTYTPSGRVASVSRAQRPRCPSSSAARKSSADDATREAVQALRNLTGQVAASIGFAPIVPHLQNTPTQVTANEFTPQALPNEGTLRKVRIVGYTGRAKSNNKRQFTMTMPDVSTTYVQPLDFADYGGQPTFRDPFGKFRPPRRLKNGTLRGSRVHLGVDYETRTAAQARAKATTSASRGVLGRVPCYAIADGTVITRGVAEGYGNVVYIDHGDGIVSRYGHLSSFKVSRRDKVKKGDVIAIAGTSTQYDGVFDDEGVGTPHMHFEIRINRGMAENGRVTGSLTSNENNIAIDPVAFLSAAPNPNVATVVMRPVDRKLAQARAEAGTLMTTSETEYATLESTQAYDQLCSVERNCKMASLGRQDYWDEQTRAAPVIQSTLEQDASIPEDAYSTYPSSEEA